MVRIADRGPKKFRGRIELCRLDDLWRFIFWIYLLFVGCSPSISSFLCGPSFSGRLAQQVDFFVRVLGFGLYNLIIFATYKASQQSLRNRVWMDEYEYS